MREDPRHRDLDIVLLTLLAFIAAASVAFVLLFVVPALFNRHRTELDIAALLVIVGSLVFAYLSGRHLWRSIHDVTDGDE